MGDPKFREKEGRNSSEERDHDSRVLADYSAAFGKGGGGGGDAPS